MINWLKIKCLQIIDTGDLVKKTDYNIKINDVEEKFNNNLMYPAQFYSNMWLVYHLLERVSFY